MSQLFIQGLVLHEPGPWGERQPVAGARVEILSGDDQTRGSDLIMLATTNATGEFQGLTTEWRGTVIKTVPDPNKPWRTIQVEEPDPDETLVLRARIRQSTADGVKMITLPVEYTDDMHPVAPLVVNWAPAAQSVIGFVNGLSCTTPIEFIERTILQINARRGEVKLEAYGQAAEPYLELTAPTARQARLAASMHLSTEEVLRIRTLLTCNDGMDLCDVVDSFWISLVVSSIIFAPITGQAAASFGLALQRLLYSGYQLASVGNATVAMNGMGVRIRLAHPEWKATQVAEAIE
ncbi:MAG: hypothetical protein MUF01_10110 [Bryobacterales bacterium]|jgi:hypothetical protein|nr:hypothetical protein [Bryobacterales bacterium]